MLGEKKATQKPKQLTERTAMELDNMHTHIITDVHTVAQPPGAPDLTSGILSRHLLLLFHMK